MRNGRTPGSFKLSNQRGALDLHANPWDIGERRIARILVSIQSDLSEGGTCRVRQILTNPRELYRLEIERPDMAYERVTILDSDALEQLLEQLPEDTVRQSFYFR